MITSSSTNLIFSSIIYLSIVFIYHRIAFAINFTFYGTIFFVCADIINNFRINLVDNTFSNFITSLATLLEKQGQCQVLKEVCCIS